MKKYAPKVLKGNVRQPSTQIWTAAKAMEAVARNMTAADPTNEDVVKGLYRSRTTTSAASRRSRSPSRKVSESNPHISCYFTMQTKNHKISSPSGMKPECVRQT